jgi:hypothetical protein
MPTPTYTPLATVTLGSTSSLVTFSNIPATYRDLIVVTNERQNTLTSSGGTYLRFNGDSGGNYSLVYAMGVANTGATGSGQDTAFTGAMTSRFTNADGNNGIAHIMDYSVTDKHKTVLSRGNQAEAVQLSIIMYGFRWRNTAAITSIACSPEVGGIYAAGSTFSLYGVIA